MKQKTAPYCSFRFRKIVRAEYYRQLKECAQRGVTFRLMQGLYPFPAPLGYLNCGGGKAKELDPMRAPLVRDAFKLVATGHHSVVTLSEEMHRRGLKNTRCGKVTAAMFSSILMNPFYMGVIHLRRTGESFPGVHRPLITEVLFDRVQQVLEAA